MKVSKKLIEVALPLDAINKASAREKSIRHGHPSTLHLWWARRPLAAARAVIFAQMVDDPSAHPDLFPTEKKQEKERQRLFRIIEDLVLWENTTNDKVLQQARDEIWQSWRWTCEEHVARSKEREDGAESKEQEAGIPATRSPLPASLYDPDKLPAFHDPFAGGGTLPLEAQRLGLESYASDLNPVAVLICKAMIEIPPKFANKPPVNPNYRTLSPGGRGQGEGESRGQQNLVDRDWHGAQGLAEDVRYYGKWMRDEAEKRIGHLYPKVKVVREKDGTYRHATEAEIGAWSRKQEAFIPASRSSLPAPIQELTVIAWLWARTVKSSNPAFAQVDVPLASSFMLSTKAGKEAYVEPILTPSPLAGEGGGGGGPGYRFTVKMGKPKHAEAAKLGTTAGKRSAFLCLMSGTPIDYDHIRNEGKAGRMGARLMAIVAKGERGRVYLPPTEAMEAVARQAKPEWRPDNALPVNPRDFKTPNYGLTTFADLFTPRQLVALTTLSDLVQEARERVKCDALAAGLSDPS